MMERKSEFKSVTTKLTNAEATLLDSYCEKKGVTPYNLIKELILKEIKIPFPQNVAGKNLLTYNKEKDNFTWTIQLDNKETIEVLKNISPEFLKDFEMIFMKGMGERAEYLDKFKKDSVPVPGFLARRKK